MLSVTQYLTVSVLFLCSFINTLYCLANERTSPYALYLVAFSAALLYQIIFYGLLISNQYGYYVEPYVGYFKEASFRRNLVFAILALIVSSDAAVKYARTKYNKVT